MTFGEFGEILAHIVSDTLDSLWSDITNLGDANIFGFSFRLFLVAGTVFLIYRIGRSLVETIQELRLGTKTKRISYSLMLGLIGFLVLIAAEVPQEIAIVGGFVVAGLVALKK